MSKTKLNLAVLGTIVLSLVLAACQPSAGQGPPATAPSPAAKPAAAPVKYVGEFSLSPVGAPAGSVVEASGKGFTPNTRLELVWQGFRGAWKVGEGSFLGREAKEVFKPMTTVTTDASGQFQATFTVPEGFGFNHDVLVKKGNETVNKANFAVQMQATISASSGPAGTPITVELKGVGWRSLENSWMLIYDNKFTGWLSAVTTDGLARTVIPATGTPGKHIIQVRHGSFTVPYLNMQQSPSPDRPEWTFEFTVTEGAPVLPVAAREQSLPVERRAVPASAGTTTIWTDVLSGPEGTPVVLSGEKLPAGAQAELLWFRVKGNRVSGQGWEEDYTSLGTAVVGNDGRLAFPFKALDDLGGAHRIEAQVKGTKVAETDFTITPSAFTIEPTSGPAGTEMTIHLKGIGWTETANIYHLVYDNAYLGYACGFNSQGDVTIYLPAAGEPGWHFIDLYPGIYKGTDVNGVNDFRIPQLTAPDDHPGEKLPVFRLAFLVTKG